MAAMLKPQTQQDLDLADKADWLAEILSIEEDISEELDFGELAWLLRKLAERVRDLSSQVQKGGADG